MCKEIKSVQSFSSGTYIALVLNATVGLATTMTPGIAKDGERKILKLLAINRSIGEFAANRKFSRGGAEVYVGCDEGAYHRRAGTRRL